MRLATLIGPDLKELLHEDPEQVRELLDELHAVLQAAFGFSDSHLHQFVAGAFPPDDLSTLFLCPWYVEDGEADGTDTEADATAGRRRRRRRQRRRA